MNSLEQSILKTLAFFDIFKYPLTETEIWKWLYRAPKEVVLSDIRSVLQNSDILKNKISQTEGFYCLKGSEHFYLLRKQNNNLAERKFARAIRLVKLYRLIPFVRMIAVCNTLAYSNARNESDIDFFVITKKDKIWLARFFALVFVQIFGLRPKENKSRDTFCFSFFIDESKLDISGVKMTKDVYFPYWVGQLMPIYDPAGVYAKFLAANNWHQQYLPNAWANDFAKQVSETWWSKVICRLTEFIFSPPLFNRWTDDIYSYLQIKIIDKNLKALVNVDSRVIINESMLKFHQTDRREYFYHQWKERLNNLLDYDGQNI